MHSTIAPFSFGPMKIVEQANRLIQHAQVLYEKHQDIIEPKDREVAKDRMSNFSRSAKVLKHSVQDRFWLAQAEEAKRYLSHAQEALGIVKRIINDANEIGSQKEVDPASKLMSVDFLIVLYLVLFLFVGVTSASVRIFLDRVQDWVSEPGRQNSRTP
ncbi:hypothetical protein BJY52DRAFT_1226895 [Lactarius psammicola]|nr:hypothetical protein BJY52DRAFT_1226895 [Lactarius psammicola]